VDAGPRSRIIKLLVYLPQVEHFLLRDGNLLTPPRRHYRRRDTVPSSKTAEKTGGSLEDCA
jgi:hypothetical protein